MSLHPSALPYIHFTLILKEAIWKLEFKREKNHCETTIHQYTQPICKYIIASPWFLFTFKHVPEDFTEELIQS